MARRRKYDIPAHPDTSTHQLIRTKEGIFWRAKRGFYKPAMLNETISAHAEAMRRASPAAKRIAAALASYTEDLQKGRLVARISGKLLRSLRAEGIAALSALSGIELQPDHPLRDLLIAGYRLEPDNEGRLLRIRILNAAGIPVKRKGRLVDSYKITAILLYGDTELDGGLHTESVATERLSFSALAAEMILGLPLPEDAEWVLALRVECFEGDLAGLHPGLRAMSIVGGM